MSKYQTSCCKRNFDRSTDQIYLPYDIRALKQMEMTFSQACENNKRPILSVIKNSFNDAKQVLEIGSGSGQHALFFAEHLPNVNWQPSDLKINHPHINQRIDNAALSNIFRPIEIDLNESWNLPRFSTQKEQQIDAVFCANTLHIVSWPLVELFFINIEKHLAQGGTLCLYGPFNYHGKFTSESNASFDVWLKNRDIKSGIRDFESIVRLAQSAGLSLSNDHEMPANNRLLVFKQSS